MYRLFLLFIFSSILSFGAQAQSSIQGKILDAELLQPLPGATILLKGTSKGTITNENGLFSLTGIPEGEQILIISYVGFNTIEKQISGELNSPLSIILEPSVISGKEVIVYAQRTYPVTKTTLVSKDLDKQNLGQDFPQLLNFTPSIVTTSDAGAGVGYTGMRIRGSDPQRINVTVNGIPLNDSESHGVFWVNMPDFASSVSDVTIQRGVGTSVNGAGAFGASVNINTKQPSNEAFAGIDNSYGSFNTWRHNVEVNTGEIGKGFNIYGRLSKVSSDGFVDRSAAELKSFYLSGSYHSEKSNVTFNIFSGQEVTHQAWWGVPEARLNNDTEGMQQYIWNNGLTEAQATNLLESDSRSYNYYIYDNEIDNYQQDHYQFLYNYQPNENWQLNTALHYTKGKGYFEQAGYDKSLDGYQLYPVINNDTITNSDIVVQRWLDNDFYGGIFSLNYKSDAKIDNTSVFDMIVGGGWNRYEGGHFGDVIWARSLPADANVNQRYYSSDATKTDANIYAKASLQIKSGLFLFGDLQLRRVNYSSEGIDNDLREINFDDNLTFFNPKFGARYFFGNHEIYTSFSIGNKEPNRSDYTDATPGVKPKHETLRNLEVGYARHTANTSFAVNYYLMDYKNQLIPTGEVNDVGGSVRTNIPSSYRTGVEIQWQVKPVEKLTWMANATFSKNINKDFTEYIINYDDFSYISNNLGNTDIAFSPDLIAGSQIIYAPYNGFEMALLSKYVGKQYLDNTSSEDRIIDAYFTNDIRLSYQFTPSFVKQIGIDLLVNNIFNELYESNGYTYAYAYGGSIIREDHFYPQAGTNFLVRLRIKI
ncbi:TonB-dependent receptor [Chondrinema litorale]|uniref:TonB-dependent receptor n=1 Tax=Chondrinema litorale TaxID=2994555 RepID=UPI002542E161|nr:TonB-dependent receptor [Chondrinema litorale]UZR95849.1 TonB-dependent receptor [Chondrinema litorale]